METYTIKEVMDMLEVPKATISRAVKNRYPEIVKHGKKTILSEEQVRDIANKLGKAKNLPLNSIRKQVYLEETQSPNETVEKSLTGTLPAITKEMLELQLKIEELKLKNSQVKSFTLMKNKETEEKGNAIREIIRTTGKLTPTNVKTIEAAFGTSQKTFSDTRAIEYAEKFVEEHDYSKKSKEKLPHKSDKQILMERICAIENNPAKRNPIYVRLLKDLELHGDFQKAKRNHNPINEINFIEKKGCLTRALELIK